MGKVLPPSAAPDGAEESELFGDVLGFVNALIFPAFPRPFEAYPVLFVLLPRVSRRAAPPPRGFTRGYAPTPRRGCAPGPLLSRSLRHLRILPATSTSPLSGCCNVPSFYKGPCGMGKRSVRGRPPTLRPRGDFIDPYHP